MRRLLVAPAFAALLALQACGGGGGPYIEDSLDVALSNGRRAMEEGRYADAVKIYSRELPDAEKAGIDPFLLAQLLNNLASAYKGEGKYDLADPLYKRSLELAEKVKGPRDPAVAVILNNYISMLNAADRQADARVLEAKLKDLPISAGVQAPRPSAGPGRDEMGRDPLAGKPHPGR